MRLQALILLDGKGGEKTICSFPGRLQV
jgi:hypothetical protein